MYYDPSGYKMTDEDLAKIMYDTDGSGYAYYQNRDYSHGLNKKGASRHYEGKVGFQAHHMLQGKWAEANLSDYGYKYGKAPTISLGTGKYVDESGNVVDSPHNYANNAQRQRQKNRGGLYYSTLNSELVFGATDLIRAGMSEGLVMSELERNYRMIDALNRQSSEKIQSGELKLLEYDRAAIERVVHDYAEQQKIERERIKQQNC